MSTNQKLFEARLMSSRAAAYALDRHFDPRAELEVQKAELAMEMDEDRIKELHALIDQLEVQGMKK